MESGNRSGQDGTQQIKGIREKGEGAWMREMGEEGI
jgi:hypothetical protein